MRIRLLVLILLLGVGGYLALLGLEWKLELGRFAESPQRVTLEVGRRAIVGGGRGVVGFVGERRGAAVVELKCAAEKTRLELVEGQTSGPVCGVRIRVLGFEGVPGQPARVGIEVSWEG
jgi:hypothetical protein